MIDPKKLPRTNRSGLPKFVDDNSLRLLRDWRQLRHTDKNIGDDLLCVLEPGSCEFFKREAFLEIVKEKSKKSLEDVDARLRKPAGESNLSVSNDKAIWVIFNSGLPDDNYGMVRMVDRGASDDDVEKGMIAEKIRDGWLSPRQTNESFVRLLCINPDFHHDIGCLPKAWGLIKKKLEIDDRHIGPMASALTFALNDKGLILTVVIGDTDGLIDVRLFFFPHELISTFFGKETTEVHKKCAEAGALVKEEFVHGAWVSLSDAFGVRVTSIALIDPGPGPSATGPGGSA